MNVFSRVLVMMLSVSLLAGCDHMSHREQRTLSGGAIGAVGGGVISAAVGGPVLLGAAVGGGAGALIGNQTR
jgi:hypothetical protein